MIICDEQAKLFTIQTKNTTYQMKVDQYRVLLHTYYGPRIQGQDLSELIQRTDRSFSPNPSEAGMDRTYSLDVMPQEYSTCGVGDFRLPSIELELPRGSHTCDLRYCGFQMEQGKYALDGLPAFFDRRGASSHQHNPFVILCGHQADEDSGLCYGAMLLYSGNFEAAVECSQYENTRMVMGIHPHHFCWTLPPNGEFTAPEAALVCSPTGFGDMSRQSHRAVREHLVRDPYQGKRRPVLINNWEATYFDFTADKLVSIAREAAPPGH